MPLSWSGCPDSTDRDYTALKLDRTASTVEIDDRKRATLAAFRRNEHKLSEAAPVLTDEQLAYLRVIRDHPGLPATKRDRLAGISLRKGSRLRQRLKASGLIEEFLANPGGQGRACTDIRVTPKAETNLGNIPISLGRWQMTGLDDEIRMLAGEN